jgi:large subunit ribosomal protein L32e
MSKRFRSQDAGTRKKLGIRWRKPNGRQSKMRRRKGGSGLVPRVGYRTPKTIRYLDKVIDEKGISLINTHVVSSLSQINNLVEANTKDIAIIIASTVGKKKTLILAESAKKQNIRVVNMKKIKNAKKHKIMIKNKKSEKKDDNKKNAKDEVTTKSRPSTKEATTKEKPVEKRPEVKKEETKSDVAPGKADRSTKGASGDNASGSK